MAAALGPPAGTVVEGQVELASTERAPLLDHHPEPTEQATPGFLRQMIAAHKLDISGNEIGQADQASRQL